jgi:hypothetical protein
MDSGDLYGDQTLQVLCDNHNDDPIVMISQYDYGGESTIITNIH